MATSSWWSTGATLDEARIIAQRIHDVVCNQPVRTSVGLIDARLSLGVATFATGADIDQALAAADADMYRNKRRAAEDVDRG